MALTGTWCNMYKAPRAPAIAELTWSGTPSAAAFTYSFSVDQASTSFLTVTSGTDINLSRGHYYAIAYPDYTRAASGTNNVNYWFIDGVQVGMRGGSDHYASESTDNAEAAFTVTASTGILTLRQTAWSGSALTLTSHCKALIWRVDI